jgi:hypothetical protein
VCVESVRFPWLVRSRTVRRGCLDQRGSLLTCRVPQRFDKGARILTIVECLRHATEGSVLRVPSSLIDDLVRQCKEIVLPCPPGEIPGLPTLARALEAVPDARRCRRPRVSALSAIT